MIGDAARAQLLDEHRALFQGSPGLVQQLDDTLSRLEQDARERLSDQCPFDEAPLLVAEAELDDQQADAVRVRRDWHQFQALLKRSRLPDNPAFWRQRLWAADADAKALLNRRLLVQLWRQQFDLALGRWELAQRALLREEMLANLRQWLDSLWELSRDLQTLGLEPGHLVDFSNGPLRRDEIAQVRQWARYLADNPGVLELCQRLGRQRKPELSERFETLWERQRVIRPAPHAAAKETLVGLSLGRELETLLPSELALAADPELTALFDLKYLDQRLLLWEQRGWQEEPQWQSVPVQRSVTVEDPMGPLLIAVDTSLSMEGVPETLAKAVALYLASTGWRQRRPCYLVSFSTQVRTLDLSRASRLSDLLAFLGEGFHGGTDLAPALELVLAQMQEETFRHGDLVVLSDFIMAELPASLSSAMAAQRERGNRFCAVTIGDDQPESPVASDFDHHWHYAPATGDLVEAERLAQDAAPQVVIPTLQGSA